jgi:hypothetical protein
MCSIAGFICRKPLNSEQAHALSMALLWYGRDRGSQSAGVFLETATKELLLKQAADPADFIFTEEFDGLFKEDVLSALLHTRQPTCGGRGDAQAQPFRRRDTVSVHNGYYFDIKGIRDKWGLTKKSGVDSELIADFVETYGINMLPKFLNSTDGPSAIAVRHKGKLYLAREQNPIHWARLELYDNDILVFASTETQVRSAMDFTFLNSGFKVHSLHPSRVYKVDAVGNHKMGKFSIDYDWKKRWTNSYYSGYDSEALSSGTVRKNWGAGKIACYFCRAMKYEDEIIRSAIGTMWCFDCWENYGPLGKRNGETPLGALVGTVDREQKGKKKKKKKKKKLWEGKKK